MKTVIHVNQHIIKSNAKKNKRELMTNELINRINQFNEIKYGNNDNDTRIVFATLKPEGTVTTAPKDKE